MYTSPFSDTCAAEPTATDATSIQHHDRPGSRAIIFAVGPSNVIYSSDITTPHLCYQDTTNSCDVRFQGFRTPRFVHLIVSRTRHKNETHHTRIRMSFTPLRRRLTNSPHPQLSPRARRMGVMLQGGNCIQSHEMVLRCCFQQPLRGLYRLQPQSASGLETELGGSVETHHASKGGREFERKDHTASRGSVDLQL